MLPELRAVRAAVQRVLSLCATDPAAACAAVAEVVAAVRAGRLTARGGFAARGRADDAA